MAEIGVLIMNLGTPDEPTTPSVRRYLREFLSDPRVIDINPLARWLLLNLVILPFRPARSAEAYQSIWSDRGSPLLVHSQDFSARLTELLARSDVHIEIAMRYQNPSIDYALSRMLAHGVERLVVLPMFPQYSSAAYGSAVQELMRQVGEKWNVMPISVIPPFYDHPGFIAPMANVAEEFLRDKEVDRYLFSFHGLPERHCRKSELAPQDKCCRSEGCCDRLCNRNKHCYRAQCFVTARLLAQRLGLASDQWEVCFQSRLGRDPWIKPYTDVRLTELAAQGVKRLAVFCPAFVTDCLETLEEVGMRGRDDFIKAGGEQLWLVPNLNAHPSWVAGAADILLEYLPRADKGGLV